MDTFQVKDYNLYRTKIGKGAFSTIYKGYKRKNPSNYYAFKKIDINACSNEEYRREFSLLRNLNHRNVIKLHDIVLDKTDDVCYMVLDYFKNGDLAKYLNGRSMKEKYARKYMVQIRDGLEYLLSKSILHRDIKPQNLLISDTFNLVITDFGLAKNFDNNFMIQTMCGSPMYMAPEIMKKDDYTIKSDLWSVGVVMYQILYGRVPFKSKNLLDLIKEVNKNDINYKNQYYLSTECYFLLQKLLIIDPNRRISWEDFLSHSWFCNDELLKNENNMMEISGLNFSMIQKKIVNEESEFNSFVYKSIRADDDFKMVMGVGVDMDHSQGSESDSFESVRSDTDVCISGQLSDNCISKTVSLPINIKNTYVVVNKNISLPDEQNNSLSDSFKKYIHQSIDFVKNSYDYLSKS